MSDFIKKHFPFLLKLKEQFKSNGLKDSLGVVGNLGKLNFDIFPKTPTRKRGISNALREDLHSQLDKVNPSTATTDSSQVIINGKRHLYSGGTIRVNGNQIIFDNQSIKMTERVINIEINSQRVNTLVVDRCDTVTVNSTVNSVKTQSGSVEVSHNVNDVKTQSGSVKVGGSIMGDVNSVSGSVKASQIHGNVKTVSGSIKRK